MYTDTYRIYNHIHTPLNTLNNLLQPHEFRAYLLSQSTSWRVSNLASTQTDAIY